MYISERSKKILAILGFILICILIGWLLYKLFFSGVQPVSPEPASPTASPTPENINRLPVSGAGTKSGTDITTPQRLQGVSNNTPSAAPQAEGGLTQTTELVSTPVQGATTNANGQGMQFYNKADGKFYMVTADGQIVPLSSKSFPDVDQIYWSPTKSQAILEFPDNSNIYYDFQTDKQVTLPKHWKDFDFSPTGNQVIMKSVGLDPNNRWLAIANADGSRAKIVEDLGEKENDVIPSWSPTNQIVAMVTNGLDFDRQEVYFVGQNKENFKSAVIEGRNFTPLWSPKGDRLLYSANSSANDYKPRLWIVNASGNSIGSGRKSLSVETWADKCVFADNIKVYCAVPKEIPANEGILPESQIDTVDQLYEINTQTGAKSLVAIPDGDFNIGNLTLDKSQSNLFFTDRNSSRLFKIGLK